MNPSKKKSDLPLRALTAAVLLSGIGALIFYVTNVHIINGVIALVAFLACYEMLKMHPDIKKRAFVYALVCVVLFLLSAYGRTFIFEILIFVLILFTPIDAMLKEKELTLHRSLNRSVYQIFSCFYIAFPMLFFSMALNTEFKREFVFLLPLACTALGDTFAYLGGKKFGKTKLAPVISPNKSVEGALFALLGGLVGSFLMHSIFDVAVPSHMKILIGLILALVGIFGDLAESTFKRAFGVKDSGNILPGHGGILDRIDAYLFTVPLGFLYWNYLLWYDILQY